MLADGVEAGGLQELGINANKSLALGGAGGSTVLPRLGDRIVSFPTPNRDVGDTTGEVQVFVPWRESLKASLDGGKLKDHHDEF